MLSKSYAKNKEREMKFMNLVLLIVSFCCMLWGIYNYSELQKLEFKTERTFMEIAKELDKLKNNSRRCEK